MIKKLLIYYPCTQWGEHAGVVPSHVVRLATFISNNSHIEVKIIDAQMEIGIPLNEKGVADFIQKSIDLIQAFSDSDTLLGFSLTSAQDFVSVLPIISKIKKNLTIPIVLGGYGASTNYSLILKKYSKLIDAIVIGLGEYPLLEIVKKYNGTKSSFANIPGVAWLNDGIVNYIKNDNRLASEINYDWKLLAHLNEYTCISTSSSFGCNMKCSFCCEQSISGNICFINSEDYSKLLISLKENFPNVNNIWLTDPEIGGRRESGEILKIISENKFRVFFNSRVDHKFDFKFFEKYADNWVVYFGLESADSETLLKMNKTNNPEQYLSSYLNNLHHLSRYNILLMVGIIVNYPLIPFKNLKNTIEFLKYNTSNYVNQEIGLIHSASIFVLHTQDYLYNQLNFFDENGCEFKSTFPEEYFGCEIHQHLEQILIQSYPDYNYRMALAAAEHIQKFSFIKDKTINLLRDFGYIGLKNFSKRLRQPILKISEIKSLPNKLISGQFQ